MGRKNFGRISGVVLDSCPEHGIWFDDGELRQVLEFVASGGLVHSRRIEIEDEERRQAQARRDLVLPGPDLGRSGGGNFSSC
jgi:Zn-finger nucleic acid-binding protein